MLGKLRPLGFARQKKEPTVGARNFLGGLEGKERHGHASERDPCNVQDLTSTVRGGEAQGVPPPPGNPGRSYLLRVISLAELASTVYPRPKQAQGTGSGSMSERARRLRDRFHSTHSKASGSRISWGLHPHDRRPTDVPAPRPRCPPSTTRAATREFAEDTYYCTSLPRAEASPCQCNDKLSSCTCADIAPECTCIMTE